MLSGLVKCEILVFIWRVQPQKRPPWRDSLVLSRASKVKEAQWAQSCKLHPMSTSRPLNRRYLFKPPVSSPNLIKNKISSYPYLSSGIYYVHIRCISHCFIKSPAKINTLLDIHCIVELKLVMWCGCGKQNWESEILSSQRRLFRNKET